jgi:hypothetical protein
MVRKLRPREWPAGLVAAIPFQVPKKTFHDIVGPLRLDGAGTLGRGHRQWVGKQLGTVVLDLLDHLLQGGRGRIIGTGPDLRGKGLNLLLESSHFQCDSAHWN